MHSSQVPYSLNYVFVATSTVFLLQLIFRVVSKDTTTGIYIYILVPVSNN